MYKLSTQAIVVSKTIKSFNPLKLNNGGGDDSVEFLL